MPHLLPAAASAIAQAAPAAAATAAKATVMGTLKSVAFNALTSLAISSALSVFSPTVGASARQVEFVIDPDGPIPFAAGRVGVSGSVVHRDTFGPDLMYYGIPFVLSGAGPITAIESFMADDYPMAFDANGGAVTEPYRQELFFRSVLGFQPAPVALSTPGGLKKGATLPGWTGAHKLSGKAAGLIVMAENSKGSAFPTGEIKPLIQLLGLKGWDPTLDSTYPGGDGPCRLNDASTWVTLTCPILWGLKWALGLWEGPSLKGAPAHDSLTDHQVGGIGVRLSGVDVPAFVSASNIAKANGWTVSAYPNTDDDKHQVLETFLQSGGATYAQRAGKISCISRAAPRASLVTISARDTAGPLEIDTAASRIDRINTLRPRFWSPAHRWQMTAMTGEVTAQAYRDEDGGRTRSRGIDFPFVSDARQTGQLAALQIANTREGIAGVVPLKPHLQRIRPGDAFTITEPGFVLDGLKCLCLNTDYDAATGVVRVSFVSETDGKYPFALGQNPTPPSPQVLTPVDPRHVTPPEAGDWTITPRPPTSGGAQQPGFDLTGFVSNATATAIIVETGPSADGPWTQAYQGPPTVTNIPIDGLQPGATYFIAIQYQRNQNYSEREVFGPFTAPNLIAGDLSPESPVRIAVTEITDRLVSVEQISATNAAAVADLEEVFGDTVSAAASAASAIQQAAIATQAKADAILAAGSAAARASEATQERIDAQTARGQAEGFRNQSAASASTATGAASTATEQAGLAATARGEAQGFAGAALDYRNQASGFVTDAETAAAASSASSVTATASKDAAENYAINQGSITPSALLWTNNPNGVPETATDATYPVVTVGGKPSMILGDNQHVFWKRAVPFVAGHVYEIQVEVEPSTASAAEISLIIWQLDGSYANLPAQNYQLTSKSIPVRGLYTQRFTPNAATVWLRPAVKGEMVGSKNPRIFSLNIIDVTAQAAAEASATAASTSASSAAASETAAGQSASAANTAKVAAETARGQAEAFKNETASSRDTATAQAALATAQAGLSAGSATLAGQKAEASSDSASLASTKADEAGASAAASRADQISAGAARDQALAALMAQGRQNLVARENVASGQLVAVSSGGASGWGFSIVGSGGNVTRTIKVGPLKANTAYSISFKARRTSGSGSLPINVDLNPDTLPERTFDIQSSALTEFKWEDITSPSTDMALATVQLRFFRATLPTGYTYEITDIKLEEGATATAWTPSPKDAAYSASASATSAASAAASDTAAGQSATAASGSATTASTKAGEASTFASQASASAGNANTAAINAGVSATSAASRAGGNIVAMGSFSDGTIGTWTGSVANVAVSGVPDGSTRALRSTGRDAYEGSLISGVWGGRRLRVSGYGVAPGPYPFKIGIHGQTAANGSHWVTTLASPANTTSWATFSGEIVVPANVNRLRPFIQSEGPQGAPDHNVQIATLRIEDVTESASAANSAAVATSQAASASASAADASISANLAASTSAVRGNLLPNGGMERGLEGISGPNLYIVNDSWGPAVRIAPAGNGTYGIQWVPVNIFGGATYTVSGDALLFADSGYRYFDMQFFDSAGAVVKDGGQKPMGPGDYSNDRARINDMAWTEQAPANATKVVVRAIFENVVNPTAMGARRVKLELGAAPATAYTADAAIGALSSQLQITASTTADIATRMATAKFEVIAAAGSDPAQLLIRADTSGSLAALVATSIRFSNVVGGQIVEAMKLIGGEVFFMRPIYIDVGSSRLIVGPGGTWVLWFGATSQTAATATRTNGAFCLGTDGKVYYGTGLLASGVTQAKIANFSGNVGRPAPLMVAGQTEAVTVPQNGRFIVEMTNGLTSSFSDSAGGLLRLYVSKDGAETQLGSLNVSAGGGDRYCDLSALNMDIVHNFAGAVKFVVKTNGNGPSTDGQGTVSGTLKATYYPN